MCFRDSVSALVPDLSPRLRLPASVFRQQHSLMSLLLLLLLVALQTAPCFSRELVTVSDEMSASVPASTNVTDSEQRISNSRWFGTLAVIGYGSLQWDYFSRTPHTHYEGWFEQATAEGGADKLGHFYTSHLLTGVLGHLYEDWGSKPEDAGKQAALSSLLVMSVMEAGDSFSDYGYSNEDMLFNLLGSYVGYRHYADPDWQQRFDIRVEHDLRAVSADLLTDYQHMKFLLAIKFDGFDALQDTPLAWLELHVGYYARDYDQSDIDGNRTAYVGVGLNLTKLFARQGWQRTATVLRYVQPPQMTLATEQGLDR